MIQIPAKATFETTLQSLQTFKNTLASTPGISRESINPILEKLGPLEARLMNAETERKKNGEVSKLSMIQNPSLTRASAASVPSSDWGEGLQMVSSLDPTSPQAIAKDAKEKDAKLKRLISLMMMALNSGNIDLAMLIFSSVESMSASQLSQRLSKMIVDAQDARSSLADQIAEVKGDGATASKKMMPLQNKMTEVNEQIQVLTSLLKDVNDQKNRTVEFSNNFLHSEQQTTMSIVRGMRG